MHIIAVVGFLGAAPRPCAARRGRGKAVRDASAQAAQARRDSLRRQPFELDVPRVTEDELAQSPALLAGRAPFILTGVASRWPSAKRWKLDHLATSIPDEWASSHPGRAGSLPFREAVQQFQQNPASFANSGDPNDVPHLRVRLSLQGAHQLGRDIGRLPKAFFWAEDRWIAQCMQLPNGTVDTAAVDNWFKVNSWNVLLVGAAGSAGAPPRSNSPATAAWQAQVVGRARWTICAAEQPASALGPALGPGLSVLRPDYGRWPGFAAADCAEATVGPGEVLYTPARWWCEAEALDTPTLGLAGLLVGTEAPQPGGQPHPADLFTAVIQAACRRCWPTLETAAPECPDEWPSGAPPIAREVCHRSPDWDERIPSYLSRCHQLWREHQPGVKTDDVAACRLYA
jgi:hypothetical protein